MKFGIFVFLFFTAVWAQNETVPEPEGEPEPQFRKFTCRGNFALMKSVFLDCFSCELGEDCGTNRTDADTTVECPAGFHCSVK